MNDPVLFAGFSVLRNLSFILSYAKSADRQSLQLVAVFTGVCGFTYFYLWSYFKTTPIKKDDFKKGPRPMFFPSGTSHTRFFPKVHSFSYSYLLAGVPIGWEGSAGGMLGVSSEGTGSDKSQNNVSSWYTIRAEDYLFRGYGYLGLQGKLRKYLESEGIRHEDYPYSYLLTAAKFLGYSFNPVSFWYLYSEDRVLAAMVLEVNNTFGERRMYFLKPESSPVEELEGEKEKEDAIRGSPCDPIISSLPITTTKPKRFTNSWPKDFHVSPFNSRKGTYSLSAQDPFSPLMSADGSVDNTITLSSSKAHAKLVARVFSSGPAINPSTMTVRQKVTFILSWWWVGLVTFPRIVREAGKLFFKRKMHVWFRPEPLKESMARTATSNEAALEAIFRAYLRHLVNSASKPLIVNYTAAGIANAGETMVSDLVPSDPNSKTGPKIDTLDFKVLTPIFYPRFTHYAHDLEAFFAESAESCTIYLSRPDLLPTLVLKKQLPDQEITSRINSVCFHLIQKMRCRPERIEPPPVRSSDAPKREKDARVTREDIRTFRSSAMDAFVLINLSEKEQGIYRIEVLKLFLSRFVALGDVEILEMEIWAVKCVFLWLLAGLVKVERWAMIGM